MAFIKATKRQARLRMNLSGPSGGGKTYSALEIAIGLGAGRVALIDTERGSAAKYADRFDFDTEVIADTYQPDRLHAALREAAAGGYGVVIIDSLTHFWNGPKGLLEMVDDEVSRQKAKGNKADTFAAWKSVDAVYRRLVQALLGAPFHVITTLRAKMEYVKGENEKTGRAEVRKVGMAPQMRDEFIYEADVEGMLDADHRLVIGKTRCPEIDGLVIDKPGRALGETLARWLSDGAPVDTSSAAPEPAPAPITTPPATLVARISSAIDGAKTIADLGEVPTLGRELGAPLWDPRDPACELCNRYRAQYAKLGNGGAS